MTLMFGLKDCKSPFSNKTKQSSEMFAPVLSHRMPLPPNIEYNLAWLVQENFMLSYRSANVFLSFIKLQLFTFSSFEYLKNYYLSSQIFVFLKVDDKNEICKEQKVQKGIISPCTICPTLTYIDLPCRAVNI
jgi:hypothetical protein